MDATVTLKINIPDNVTQADAEEWLRFSLHEHPEMSGSNPLVDEELEPYYFKVEFS